MMKSKIIYLSVALLAIVSSCKIGHRYVRPDLGTPSSIDGDTISAADTMSVADMKWWEIYTDTILQSLINTALQNNKDIKIAAARVKELAAQRRVSVGAMLPSVGATAYAQREVRNYGGDDYTNDPEIGLKLTASWEIDLWGNLRWAKDQSTAQVLAAIQSERALKISIVSQIATSYFELVALDQELSIVRQTLNARAEGIKLAKLRFEGGLTTETPYQQAQVEYARTATLIPVLERNISIKQNDIAFLLGEYPQHILRSNVRELSPIADYLPVGLPSTMLERRPDVLRAEQNLIAANAGVGVAYTNLFPRLTLTGQFGAESEEFDNLFKSPVHFLSAGLLGPIFEGGKRRAKLKAQEAAYEQACYEYEKTVLNAFKEARNAIVDFNKVQEIYQSRLQLEQSTRTTMELAQLQYINGVIAYLDVLDAQRSYFDAQIGLSNAMRDKRLALVQLYKTLGGGWSTF